MVRKVLILNLTLVQVTIQLEKECSKDKYLSTDGGTKQFFLSKKMDTKIIKKKVNVLVLQETYGPTETPDGRISAALAAETDNLDPGSDSEVTEKAAEQRQK